MESDLVATKRPEPVPRSTDPDVEPGPTGPALGQVRVPIAGPYRPWARLYRRRDGRLAWRVRLWEVDRPVARWVDPDSLRSFARASRLPALAAELESIVERARSGRRP